MGMSLSPKPKLSVCLHPGLCGGEVARHGAGGVAACAASLVACLGLPSSGQLHAAQARYADTVAQCEGAKCLPSPICLLPHLWALHPCGRMGRAAAFTTCECCHSHPDISCYLTSALSSPFTASSRRRSGPFKSELCAWAVPPPRFSCTALVPALHGPMPLAMSTSGQAGSAR